MKPIHSGAVDAVPGGVERAPSLWGALAALSLSVLLSSYGASIANVALPTLAAAFGASFQEVQWVVLAYLLAVTSLIVSVGRLGDLLGRRRLLRAGILLFTAASALAALAPTLWLLIAARAAQGLGAAVMMALAMALVGETVPKARTGSVMGLLGSTSAIGTAIGPSLGGVLIAGFGWPAIFLFSLPLGALALLLAHRYLPADRIERKKTRQAFDSLGTLLLALTLAAYALAMTMGRGSFGLLNIALLAAGLIGAGLFIAVEKRTTSPLIQLSQLRDPALSASLLMNALVSTVMMATLIVGPFYLARALHLNEVQVGLVLAIGPTISALSGVVAGRIVDHLGAPFTVTGGLAVMATGAFALSALPGMFGLAGYVMAIAVLTPGYQLFQAANNTDVMKDVPADRRGVISGLLNLSRNLGLVTGAAAMGAAFAYASKAQDIATAEAMAVTAGMRMTFIIAGGLVVLAIVVRIWERSRARRTARSLAEAETTAGV